jgi:predicted dehydrogenase
VPVYIPDYLSVQGEFAGGIAFSMNLATNLGVGHANGIYIFGTKGTVFFDLSQLKLFQATQEVPQFKPVEISETRHRGWQVEADFIDSIRHGTPVGLTSFLEGLRYMAFTEAVSRSVAGNSRVTVPLAGESF